MITLTNEFLIKINSGADLHECQSYVGPHPDNINEIIPICYYGRSGTVFFSSLLDGHPEIIKVGDFDFREYFKYFEIMIGRDGVESQLSNCIKHYGRNIEYEGKFNQNFVEINNKLIHVPATLEFSTEKPSEGKLFFSPYKDHDPFFYKGPYIGYLISTFLHMVKAYYGDVKTTTLTEKDFFTVFNLAYNWVVGRQYAESVTKIAWNMHMPDPVLANNAQKFFPKITLIHMIRKPLQTLGSHFKRYMYPTEVEVKNDIPTHDYVNKLFGELLNGDLSLVECRSGDDEFAIRLEDIHTSPEKTMRKVSQRLGVSWAEVLLESTYFGSPKVWDQSSQRGLLTGFSTKHLEDDHPDIFTADDIKFIEGVFYENYKKWGYNFAESSGMDKNIHDYVKKRVPVPLKMEVMCWERACQQGAMRADIMKSYGLLRDAIEKRLERKQFLLDLM